MENINELMSSPLGYVADVLTFVAPVALLLYMHFYAKYRNKTLGLSWYICGFLFTPITAIVFWVKSKKFPTPETRICPQCNNEYPEGFTMCNRCLIELPEPDTEGKKKQSLIAKIFLIVFVITFVASTVITGIFVGQVLKYGFDALNTIEDMGRIAVVTEDGDKVYYDKMGNTYEDQYDVVIYGEDGEKYTYFEDDDYIPLYYYVGEDGTQYESIYCYVNEDGWFVYDEDGDIVLEESSKDKDDLISGYDENMSEEDEAEFIDDFLELAGSYKYYEDVYTDEDGNCYYWAEEASWNEKGELITAENDPRYVTE